ncbi:MAG: rhomboid family intramembrane serine protease [Myxococcota bacterium]
MVVEHALIPIRDINPRVRFPFMNILLMVGCGVTFGFQLSLGPELGPWIQANAFVPARLRDALASRPELLIEVGTAILLSMFLHGGWFHIIGNLLYLRVFGDNVEDRLGHLAYPVFYGFSGIVGAVAQYLAQPGSRVPMVGASGAVAGVLGAYIVLFPKARVVTLFPIFVFLTFIEVPAFVFLGLWGLQQLLNGYASVTGPGAFERVAWFAHLGGFGFGLLCGILMRLRRRRIASGRAL